MNESTVGRFHHEDTQFQRLKFPNQSDQDSVSNVAIKLFFKEKRWHVSPDADVSYQFHN